jgi:hypothetical protein
MSNKFKIDSSKFIYNDDFMENDLDVLENVSTIRQVEETKENEPEPQPPTEELNDINLNSDDEVITIPKD